MSARLLGSSQPGTGRPAARKSSSTLRRGLLIGLAAAFLTLFLAPVFRLDRAELQTFDLRLRWRVGSRLQDNNVQVLIIAIDEKTLSALKSWPLPRTEYVRLVRYLKQCGARSIGFDLRFEEDRPAEDRPFAQAMREAGNAFLGIRFDPQTAIFTDPVDILADAEEEGLGEALKRSRIATLPEAPSGSRIRMKGADLPPAQLARAAQALGSLTIVPEADGIVRQFPMVAPYVRPNGTGDSKVYLYAGLPLLMAADFLNVPLSEVEVIPGREIRIGDRHIPINASGEAVINYYGGFRSLHHLSYIDVINGAYEPDDFRGKAVIVGNTLSGGFDIQVTPYSGQYPGVEAQATVLQNILDGSTISRLPAWSGVLLFVVLALGIGATHARPLRFQIGAALAALVLLLVFSYWLLASHYLWMEVVRPALAILLAFAGVSWSTFLAEQAARAQAEGAVKALAEVSRVMAHAQRPTEMLPALREGLARVLGARSVDLIIEDSWMREHLLLPADARQERTSSDYQERMVVRDNTVGYLGIRSATEQDPALVAAVTNFAALVLENSALSEETRNHFLTLTTIFAEMIESNDPYTAGHCSRVMEYACAMGKHMGWSPEEMDELRYGALLHDVGKIGVPGTILNKPGRLDDEEMATMRRHPALGQQWLQRATRLRRVAELVATHHERWDGKGYPHGLSGEEIPLGGRILAVADVWDALTSDRPYRAAMPVAQARQIIEQGRGTQFDPRVVDAFLPYLEEMAGSTREATEDAASA